MSAASRVLSQRAAASGGGGNFEPALSRADSRPSVGIRSASALHPGVSRPRSAHAAGSRPATLRAAEPNRAPAKSLLSWENRAPRPSNQGILVQEAGGGGADRQESRRKSSIAPLNAGQGPPDGSGEAPDRWRLAEGNTSPPKQSKKGAISGPKVMSSQAAALLARVEREEEALTNQLDEAKRRLRDALDEGDTLDSQLSVAVAERSRLRRQLQKMEAIANGLQATNNRQQRLLDALTDASEEVEVEQQDTQEQSGTGFSIPAGSLSKKTVNDGSNSPSQPAHSALDMLSVDLGQPVRKWKVFEVTEWFAALGCGGSAVASAIAARRMDGTALLTTDDSVLRSLGIQSIGVRKRVLRAARMLREAAIEDEAVEETGDIP